jgi:CheY-like chemotaxis protein
MVASEPLLILVVEDEEPIAMALSFILEDAGYQVFIAKHGRQALDFLRDHHPVIIFTDLMMPYLNGEQLIIAVRERFSDIPIVLMTAAGPRYSANVGADQVMLKPFNIDDVEAILHQFFPIHS